MYPALKKYLLDSSSKSLLSGMMSAAIDYLPVGSPCLLDMERSKKNSSGAKMLMLQIEGMLKEGAKAQDINPLFDECRDKVSALSIFGYRSFGRRMTMRGYNFYCFDTKPLLLDEGKVSTVKSIGGIATTKALKNFPARTLDNLSKHRYITYVLSGLCKSNYDKFRLDASNFIKTFSKIFPYNACVDVQGDTSYTIVDTVAISFYRLTDIIPIFDTRSLNGLALEMFFTNSTLDARKVNGEGNSFSLRWLFSQDEDNVFTIDGEKIEMQFQDDTNRSLSEHAFRNIERNIPNDKALKKKSAKSKNGGN